MSTDEDGYGFGEGDRSVKRLIDDVRVLSPSGIERIAGGWDKFVGDDVDRLHAAEKAAVHAIESNDLGEGYSEVRRQLFGLTESDVSLVNWKGEHGEQGHKAERAVQAAALALVAGELIDDATRQLLLKPVAEALPWLSPDS
ncbi:MAG: hypothetical protein JOY80_09070 [Candidatus Dormibacteraeota bacterium]|nr:hypothetical protein [Candidatus Dormibacteraeota bacterium]